MDARLFLVADKMDNVIDDNHHGVLAREASMRQTATAYSAPPTRARCAGARGQKCLIDVAQDGSGVPPIASKFVRCVADSRRHGGVPC
jgi:hypothetical protein